MESFNRITGNLYTRDIHEIDMIQMYARKDVDKNKVEVKKMYFCLRADDKFITLRMYVSN